MQQIDFSDVQTYEFLKISNDEERAQLYEQTRQAAIHQDQEETFNRMIASFLVYECSSKGKPYKIWENLNKLYINKNIILKYNELKRQIESNTKWYVYDDFITQINSMCMRTGLYLTKDHIWGFTAYIANQKAYNPVKKYLKKAYKKFKATKGADELTKLLQTITYAEHYSIEDRLFNEKMIIKWLISGVKMGMNDGSFNAEFTIVFKGKQGIGKTRWFRALIPKEFLVDFFKDGVQLDLSSKDSVIQATSYWLCELGELGGTMRKSDRDALKAWLTSTHDEFRMPYSRKAEKFPRRTFFASTVNDDEFLRDATGNRRFIVIDVEALNHTHNIDVDLLWGQIVAMYLQRENTHLNQEEIKLNNDRNKVYFVKSDEQLIIEDILPLNQPMEKWGYITSTALCNYLEEKHGKKLSPQRVGRALTSMGFEQEFTRLKEEKNKSRYYKMPFIKGYSIPF